MRESILRELAVRSLQAAPDLEDHLQRQLIQAATRERITLYEFIRERLLLKAGVSRVGALIMLADHRSTSDPLVNGRPDHPPHLGGTDAASGVSKAAA